MIVDIDSENSFWILRTANQLTRGERRTILYLVPDVMILQTSQTLTPRHATGQGDAAEKG